MGLEDDRGRAGDGERSTRDLLLVAGIGPIAGGMLARAERLEDREAVVGAGDCDVDAFPASFSLILNLSCRRL